MTVPSGSGGKWWFNGLPFQTVAPKTIQPGTQKYWFNGLPMSAYSEVVHGAIYPNLITDSDAIYQPSIAATSGIQTLTPALVTDADNFFAPAITTGAATLTPDLVTDADNFFAPILAFPPQVLTPSLVVDTDTFHAPAISQVTVLAPSLVTDADNFFAADVFRDNRFIDVDIFYPFVSTVPMFPSWYREGDTFYPVSLAATRTLFAPPLVDIDTAHAPIVGVRTLTAPFVNSDVVIYPAAISRYTAVLPPSVSAAEAIFAPTILRGARTLSPSRVIDPDIIRSPIIGIVQVTPNPPGGSPDNLPGNLKYVSRYAMTQSGLILSMDLQSSTAKTINTRMLIYRETAGLPAALAGVTVDKTSVVTGVNHYTLVAPVSVLAGDNIWMGLHSDGNFNWFLSNSPGGSKWNTDTWVGGASDPFGPVNNDNKKAPIVVYYLSSSNASITVDKVIDLDVIYAPAISQLSILRPPLVVEEYFYAHVIRSIWTLAPEHVGDADTIHAPTRGGSITIRPALFASDDVIYSSFIATYAPTVFSAPVPHDDEIYPATVVLPDARLLPQRVVDTDVFYAPERSSSKTLLPFLVTSFDVFFAPVVSRGAITLAPPLIDSNLDIFTPEITTFGGPETITPPLVTDIDVFYPPSRVLNKGWRRQVYVTGTDIKDVEIIGVVPTPELVE